MFLKVQFLTLFFSLCILSLCLPLLTHTLSYIIHLLMTHNYRCLLPHIEYLSYFQIQIKLYFPTYIHTNMLYMMKYEISANMLNLNDNKTELMLVTSNRTKHLHNLPTSITIGNAHIPITQSVKNLGHAFDRYLTMNAHVSNIAQTCYFELRRLATFCRFLTGTATATLVSAFVLSRIEYCSSLLFCSTHDVTSHLQRIQNYAARVILRLPKSSNITTH